jgi:WD40 repeat protein
MVWRLNPDVKPAADAEESEIWTSIAVLRCARIFWIARANKFVVACRGTNTGIYDLAWSPNDDYILGGSIDNSAMVWEFDSSDSKGGGLVRDRCNVARAGKGRQVAQLRDHTHYVQGAAWSPDSRFFVTLSADRSLCVYDASGALANARDIAAVAKMQCVVAVSVSCVVW